MFMQKCNKQFLMYYYSFLVCFLLLEVLSTVFIDFITNLKLHNRMNECPWYHNTSQVNKTPKPIFSLFLRALLNHYFYCQLTLRKFPEELLII